MSVFVGAAPALRIYRGATQLWLAYPDRLFQAETGLLLDPSRLASLYQDQAGTQPVTAAGQPVGLIRDQSGGGRHASRAISAARPTYDLDAALRPLIRFDGVDDSLVTPAMTLGAAGRTIIAAVRKRSDAVSGAVVETGTSWSATPGGAGVFMPHANATASYGARARPAAVQSLLGSPLSYPAPHTAVVTATSADGSHVLRINGAVAATGAPAGPMTALTAVLNIGARNGNQLFAAMDLYSLLVIDRVLTASELTQAEAWAAEKCGVILS